MIDESMYDRYNKDAEKSLQPLNEPNSGRPDMSSGTAFDHLIDSGLLDTPYAPPALQMYRHAAEQAKRQAARIQSQIKRKHTTQSRSDIG